MEKDYKPEFKELIENTAVIRTAVDDNLSLIKGNTSDIVSGLRDLYNLLDGDAMAKKEADREAASKVPGSNAVGGSSPVAGGASSSVGGGMMGALGGLGTGAGMAMGGVGLLAGGAGYLLSQLNDFDGKKIKENVKHLLSIQDLFDGVGDFFGKTGVFLGTMTGLGVGLAAFGVGSAIAGVGDAVAEFSAPNFAQKIVDNVNTLLKITEGRDLASLVKSTVSFLPLMTSLGVGLAAFAIGQGTSNVSAAITKFSDGDWAQKVVDNVDTLLGITEGRDFISIASSVVEFPALMLAIGGGLVAFAIGQGASGVGDAITKFSDGTWAQKIVDNVDTLLTLTEGRSFGSLVKNVAFFPTLMTAIGGGLVAFSAGQVASGAADAITKFGEGDWAQKIVDNVETLLLIPSLPGVDPGNVAAFGATMLGIGAGLIAFSLGKGADGAASAIQQFSGDNFGERIKTEVTSILSVLGDPNVSIAKAEEFSTVMGSISAGLLKFSGGKLVSALTDAAGAVLNFFSGSESPVTQMLNLAKHEKGLHSASAAIDKLTVSLAKVSQLSFDGSKMKIKQFAQDLVESVPVIEAAIMGGEIDNWGPWNTSFKGLSNPSIDYDTAIKRIRELRGAFNKVNGDLDSAIESRNGSGIGPDGAGASITDASNQTIGSYNSTTTYNQYGLHGIPAPAGLYSRYNTGV